MGLIHSRARKQRDRAEAAVFRAQAATLADAEAANHARAYISGDYPGWRLTIAEWAMVRKMKKLS